MTIECHNAKCKNHGNHEGEEGPFCFMQKCQFEPHVPAPYFAEELERDNPFNSWMEN